MRIENGFDVPLPPAEAWRVLLDIERITPCMPGAQLLESLGDNAYKGKVAVKLGPVAVSFVGTARFEAIDEAARKVRVRAGGSDEKGRGGAQATVDFALAEATPGSTHVAIATDLSLNGAVAQYGRGAAMIQDMAQQIVGRFAANLRHQIEAGRSAAPVAPAAMAPKAAEAQAAIAATEIEARTGTTPATAAAERQRESAATATEAPAGATTASGRNAVAPEATPSFRIPPAAPAKPISGLSLFLGALWRAVKRLFGAA
jgi:carbon monoxide dehydrogenase subunit G